MKDSETIPPAVQPVSEPATGIRMAQVFLNRASRVSRNLRLSSVMVRVISSGRTYLKTNKNHEVAVQTGRKKIFPLQ